MLGVGAQLATSPSSPVVSCAPAPVDALRRVCAELNDCNGHGRCVDAATIGQWQELPCSANVTAACLCRAAWTGKTCGVPACPHGCFGRGSCRTESGRRWCACDEGWSGDDCGTAACPLDCSGRGVCGEDKRCMCEAGWGGGGCEQRLCEPSATCSNHGMCVGGVCHCGAGWQGAACELRACLNDCSGHGTCDGNGTCSCMLGYGGDDCSELACPNGCSGRGRCLGYGSTVRQCKCDAGWGGEDCSERVCPAPGCGEHGVCIDGACLCASGFDGPTCAIALCPSGCSGHGECDGLRCQCDDGWGGEDCSERGCVGGCGAHQFCFNGTCACLPGRTGLSFGCSLLTCPRGCGVHGHCRNGTCACETGYGGLTCAERVCPRGGVAFEGDTSSAEARVAEVARAHAPPARALSPGSVDAAEVAAATRAVAVSTDAVDGLVCSGHGECVGGQCACDEGYRSYDCSRRTCENGCSGHGRCGVDGVCSCYQGWFGVRPPRPSRPPPFTPPTPLCRPHTNLRVHRRSAQPCAPAI